MSIINVLGESAVRSLALALAVAIVLRVLRVQHALLAKRAWTSVLILALAMPALVALHIPSFSFLALWSTPRTVIVPAAPSVSSANPLALDTLDAFALNTFDPSSRFTSTPQQPELFAPAVVPHVPVPTALQGPAHGAPAPARHIAWWQIGFAAYLAISALLLLRVLLGLGLALRLWHRAQPFATSETNLPARLSVRLSLDLRSPATVGHGILLPLEAIDWDDAALRATLAHEAQHIREGDFYLQLAATLHHCFFWISPHAWWLRPQLSRLSETICDRAAIASSGDGLSYAQLLVRFATAERTPEGMLAMAQSAGLRERIERLIADPELSGAFRRRRGQAIAAAALLATAAILAAASVHIVQPATIVLAAPQAPAPPAAAPAAPALAPPDAAAPDVAPLVPPPPDTVSAPDAVLASSVTTVDESTSEVESSAQAAHVSANIHVKTTVMPKLDTRVVAIRNVDSVSPMLAVQSLATVHPLFLGKDGMHLVAMPQVAVVSPDTNGPIDRHGRGYAIYGPDGDHMVMMHGWFGDTDSFRNEKAKHPGGSILFERDGKTYVIDDPALVKQAQQAYAHVNELGKQQGVLGEKQGKLGEQQGDLGEIQGQIGELQGELGAMNFGNMSDFKFEMPKDFEKNMQVLTDSETHLALERDKLSQQQIAELERQTKEAQDRFNKDMEQFKAQQPQREAMEKQMRDQAEQIQKQMEPLLQKMRELGAKQGDLGRLQGELGRQQGLLGRQQGEASREADTKVQSLIDQAMKDGKAHPVQ
jgi:BlaR1 peptidase M56